MCATTFVSAMEFEAQQNTTSATTHAYAAGHIMSETEEREIRRIQNDRNYEFSLSGYKKNQECTKTVLRYAHSSLKDSKEG